MPQSTKQIKLFISCPSDVEKEKNIVSHICETLSRNIFSKKNIDIRTIHWAKDVPRKITGEEPQKIIDRYLDEEDYDIYLGIMWGRFGEPQSNGLSPTEDEFENALKRQRETGRPIISFFFKEENLYPNNEYEASQLLAIQKFKSRFKEEALGLYDSFNTDLQLQEKVFISIQQIVEQLTITGDSQIVFQRIKYPEVISYISRKIYPEEEYKPDEFWFLREENKKELTNIIRLKNRIALIGDAGSGKTIELERVANHFSCENSAFYPLFIHLNTYSNQNIADLLPENWNNIPEKQLLIILDGLDEIESKNKNDAVRKIILFSERYPSSIIIVSCRTNFYQTESEHASGTLSGFESYRLLDLDFDQINSYVENMLLAKKRRFFNQVNNNHLDLLLKIPFYLVNLVEIFEKENSLPEKRGMIFERLVIARMKLDVAHFRTTIDLEENGVVIFKNLERVALGMECLGRNYLLDEEYGELVPDASSRDLLKHCTAWKKISDNGIQWQFEHNSIQEYLAARVLSRQTLSVIKDFVSFKPDYKKVIPSWVNTVSFLLSISNDSNLLNWILEIEPEICLKFEADRIQKKTRIKIFQDIFNRYKEKKISIDIDRFRNDELARFGQSDEILSFLLNEAEKPSHLTTLNNAIEIISEMNLSPAYKDRVGDFLEKVATNNFIMPVTESIQCTGLMTLSRLKFDSKNLVDRVVSKLRTSKSDWVRYGLYCFLHQSDYLDQFIDVFLEGIPYVSFDFSSGGLARLGNERWELKQGLKKAKSPYAIKQIMNYFIEKERDIHDMFVGDHDISFIAEAAAKAYFEDPSLLNLAVDFSFSMIFHHYKEETGQFLKFYEKTGTKLDAFKIGMGKESTYREDFLAKLADENCIQFFINQYEQENVSDDLVWKFLYALRWKNNEIFESFYSIINQRSNDKFILKPVPDWDTIQNERRKRDIHLIFDTEGLLNEIELIFETEGKEKLTIDELYKLKSDSWPNEDYSDLACKTLRQMARKDKVINLEKVKESFSKTDWDWFRISHIYDRFRTNEDLRITQDQTDWISQWCYSNLDMVDFKKSIQKTNERSFSIRWNAVFVWYFFRKFDLKYPKNILMDMLSFDYQGDGIEYLETYLDETEMTSRILENLNKGIPIDDVLKNHISYCKRHKVKEAIKYALKEINTQNRESHDEVRRISLETICELSEDLSELEETLPKIKDEFKWQVIDEIIKRDGQKVRHFLEKLFKEGHEEDRLKSSEYLIKYQDLNALRFYVDWIKENREVSQRLIENSPLRSLKISDAIPLLMELLDLSYREDFKESDPFERLDRLVLDSLTVIAFESDKNYIGVKKIIEEFIEKFSSIYLNVNWLNAFLDRLEQKYYINKSEKLEIEDVIKKLVSMGF